MNTKNIKTAILGGLAGLVLSACQTTPPPKNPFNEVIDLENGYETRFGNKALIYVETAVLFNEGEVTTPSGHYKINDGDEALLRVCELMDGILPNEKPDSFISEKEVEAYRARE